MCCGAVRMVAGHKGIDAHKGRAGNRHVRGGYAYEDYASVVSAVGLEGHLGPESTLDAQRLLRSLACTACPALGLRSRSAYLGTTAADPNS